MRVRLLHVSVPLLLVLASCRERSTEPADVISVNTALSSTTLRTGEAVTITVTATNISTRPVTIQGNTCPRPYVVLQGAEAVAPGGMVCPAISIPIDLAPGGSHTFTYRWAGDRRKDEPTLSSTIQLAAGSYTIRGVVAGGPGEVLGNPVTITIAR